MEHSAMAKVWYKLIIEGKKILDDVPEKWRAEVEEMLEENPIDEGGEIDG